tara:strand:+ start:2001 stop:2426 length:426 start_codon:yes stop_codon:yes gene_type:complete
MTIASVTTDINIGPFRIPSNAQNMIMNNYANRNQLLVEVVIPEPIKSDQLATTQWLHKDFNFSNIILCSIHQLPRDNNHLNALINKMPNVNFHFAIEGIKGSGHDFIKSCHLESGYFQESEKIESKKLSWSDLYKLMKEDK